MAASSCSGVTVGVRRGVTAFQSNLVGAHAFRLQEEPRVQFHAAFGSHIDLDHPAADTIRVELFVPRRVEPVREVNALAVAADLDHLRATVQRLLWLTGVRGAADNAAESEGGDFLRLERVAD